MKSSIAHKRVKTPVTKSLKILIATVTLHSYLLLSYLSPQFTTWSSEKVEQELLNSDLQHVQRIQAISVSSSCSQVLYLFYKLQNHQGKTLLFKNVKPSRRALTGGFEGGHCGSSICHIAADFCLLEQRKLSL